jgi:hypothetical protein
MAPLCASDHLWVVDKGTAYGKGDAVTEINAATGHVMRVLSSPGYEFDAPDAIAVGGAHVWVTNGGTPLQPPSQLGATGNSVTEINANTGSLIRVIGAAKDQLNYLVAVVTLGSHVWAGSLNNLTELNASDGSLVRVIHGTGKIQTSPTALTVTGSKLWEATLHAVVERNGTTGASIRSINPNGDPRGSIVGIASDNDDVWAVNFDNSVAEINAATGRHVVINGARDTLDEPRGIALSPKDVWVSNPLHDDVVEINMTTGSLVRLIR